MPAETTADSKALKQIALKQSCALINRLVETAKLERYLEIGVQRGITFLDVKANFRDGVDPNFLFDTGEHKSTQTRFFSMPSDEFFASEHCQTYDLIFIDGWHSFEQALRDFLSSLLHWNVGGAILIDDVFPCDYFSALGTQAEAVEARRAHGLGTGINAKAWSGDVFKLVCLLHDYFPTLDYVTIQDRSNPHHKPQTLVWRSSRKSFVPQFKDLETIQRLSWFDLGELDHVFKFVTIDDGIDQFLTMSKPRDR